MIADRRWGKWFLLVLVAGFCFAANAGIVDKLTFYRKWLAKNRVQSLIVTGNYAKSRLLAELVQYKTKQPILIISSTAAGETELYFMPSAPEAVVLEPSKYVEFVDFLKPERIVFVGDSDYMPARFKDQLRDRYPSVVVNSSDWSKNAEAMAGLFKHKKLPELYNKYLRQLDDATSGRPATMDTLIPPGAPAEPFAPPTAVVPAQ